MSNQDNTEQLLPILKTICEQQAAISNQLAELMEALNKQPEGSLIDELAELLAPLSADLSEIKRSLASSESSDQSEPPADSPTA